MDKRAVITICLSVKVICVYILLNDKSICSNNYIHAIRELANVRCLSLTMTDGSCGSMRSSPLEVCQFSLSVYTITIKSLFFVSLCFVLLSLYLRVGPRLLLLVI